MISAFDRYILKKDDLQIFPFLADLFLGSSGLFVPLYLKEPIRECF